jgi:hypothetical protein
MLGAPTPKDVLILDLIGKFQKQYYLLYNHRSSRQREVVSSHLDQAVHCLLWRVQEALFRRYGIRGTVSYLKIYLI